MHINYFIFPFIIILGIVLGISDSSKNRRAFIYIVTVMLMLQTSLRSLSVGSDTASYYYVFFKVQDMSWLEIWESFLDRYLYRTSEDDAGYLIMQKTIGTFTSSWHLFVFIAQLTFFIPLGKLMYKYSNRMRQLVFAYVLYVALFHIIALSGGRQLYAIGMTILSFLYLDEKKYAKSISFVFLGAFIHLSSLLFLLPIILSKFNVKLLKTIHLITLLLLPLTVLFVNEIIVFMGSVVKIEKYAEYGMGGVSGGAWTFIALLVLSSAFCFIAFKQSDLQRNTTMANLYIMAPLFTFFGPLIHSNGSMIRISMYFHLYLMLLLPYAFNKIFKGNDRIRVYFFVIVALLVLSLRNGGLVYYFYWQGPQFNY